MKTRADWKREQERFLAAYDSVRRQLKLIPGVREVGIGLRRRAGAVVDDAAFVVAVDRKRPLSDLAPGEIVPAAIDGFPTDVVEHREPILLLGFGDENDKKNYKTKVGGISISSDGSSGAGTLGCFCKQTSDNATVMLSCHHVLLDGSAEIGAGVGQPKYDYSCCCTCNEIGKVLKGDRNLDCAIASLKSDVPFFPKIRRIKKADGTVEEEGLITGTDVAVMNQVVFKIGKRTGLTRGKISLVAPRIEVSVDAAFSRFCNRGDSGSVIVEKASGKVVALLYAMPDESGTTGLGKPIAAVQAVMGVTVLPSDPTASYTESMYEEDESDAFALPPASPFEALVERLRTTEAGRDLLEVFERHRDECLSLVQARRGFTVAWHRHHGPAWLAALGRSAREPIYQVPDDIGGVTRANAIARIVEALRVEARDDLRRDLDRLAGPIGTALIGAPTVQAWCERLESVLSRR